MIRRRRPDACNTDDRDAHVLGCRSSERYLPPPQEEGAERALSRRALDRTQVEVGMGKRVLITGGAGFIGSHLADALLAKGYSVRALDISLAPGPRRGRETTRLPGSGGGASGGRRARSHRGGAGPRRRGCRVPRRGGRGGGPEHVPARPLHLDEQPGHRGPPRGAGGPPGGSAGGGLQHEHLRRGAHARRSRIRTPGCWRSSRRASSTESRR